MRESASSATSGALFSHRGERETRVTGDEAQGTIGRKKICQMSRPFSPSRPPLRAGFHRERDI